MSFYDKKKKIQYTIVLSDFNGFLTVHVSGKKMSDYHGFSGDTLAHM